MMPRLPSVLLVLTLPLSAQAASVAVHGLAERVQRAHRVVRARVVASQVQLQDNDPRRIFTLTRLEVLETLKGAPATELELWQLGGKQGRWELKVSGDASLQPGEEAVFLLRCRDPKLPQRCTLVALQDGRVPVVPARGGTGREVDLPGLGRRPWSTFAKDVRKHAALPNVDVDAPPSPVLKDGQP